MEKMRRPLAPSRTWKSQELYIDLAVDEREQNLVMWASRSSRDMMSLALCLLAIPASARPRPTFGLNHTGITLRMVEVH
jgi:hypothetical protein